jgi:hypothetical protein
MRLAPVALEQRVVGDLVEQLVAEHVLAGAVGRGLAGDELAAPQLRQMLGRAGVDVRQRRRREPEADDAGELQRATLGRWQAVEAAPAAPR